MSNGPGGEYARRLEERRAVADRLRRKDSAVGSAGLWALLVFAALLLPVLLQAVPIAWLVPPLAVAWILWVAHAKLEERLRPLDAAVRFYERGLERVEDRWAGKGRAGTEFEDPKHPYAADLDLFGRGSVFELLCTVQTRSGERALADWLLVPAAPAEVRERQAAVRELTGRLDLREDLFVLAGELEAKVRPEELTAWAAAPTSLTGNGLRRLAWVLTAANLAALAAWLLGASLLPFAGTIFATLTFLRVARPKVFPVMDVAEKAERELLVLSKALERLEREEFRCPRLSVLQASLREGGAPASVLIARLARLVQLLQSVRNEIFRILGAVVLWRVHLAFAVEAWRAAHGARVARWLAAVGELEVLAALSSHAFEHPADPFPEICEDGLVYEAEQLGHPLLPVEACVRNDVRLGEKPRALIVSGSNMSGKSTLLRTVGTNAVLALAGAPVRAKSLRLSPVSIGATIRIQDSLQAGTSRFYAEIGRLRQVMDLAAGPRPVLFLLEEILHGTNSHDRAIGAEAILKGLMEKRAIGLVTTHDLALTSAAEKLDGRAANVHFEDQIENGKLAFDYRLRPGVVTKSNALQLMRSVGLPV